MSIALIICPYTLLDLIDEESEWFLRKSDVSKSLIELLFREKDKVCTTDAKRFRACMPVPAHEVLIRILIEACHYEKESIMKKIEMLKTLYLVLEREGTMSEEEDSFESVLELARELDDEHEVYIISHHQGKIETAKSNLQKKTDGKHDYDKFTVIDIKSAFAKVALALSRKDYS